MIYKEATHPLASSQLHNLKVRSIDMGGRGAQQIKTIRSHKTLPWVVNTYPGNTKKKVPFNLQCFHFVIENAEWKEVTN